MSERSKILELAHQRKAERVRIFGSVLRGDAGPASDVDFLVDFEPDASVLDQVGLVRDLEDLLGVGVEVVSAGGLQPRHEGIVRQAPRVVMAPRRLYDLLADLEEAIDAAAELVSCGQDRWETERPLRLAGEAVIGRIGDVASKLPDEVIRDTSEGTLG
jgi:hypothetical protein